MHNNNKIHSDIYNTIHDNILNNIHKTIHRNVWLESPRWYIPKSSLYVQSQAFPMPNLKKIMMKPFTSFH